MFAMKMHACTRKSMCPSWHAGSRSDWCCNVVHFGGGQDSQEGRSTWVRDFGSAVQAVRQAVTYN